MDQQLRDALDTGRQLYAKKEFARAAPYLTQLAAADVPYADVYNMLGVIHHDSGRFSKAQECFEKALGINPGYTEASLNLAVTYNDMGQYVEAKDIYLKALTNGTQAGSKLDAFSLGKLSNMYSEIANVYCSAGAFEEGIGEYQRALALRPEFVDLRLRLAAALRDAGRAHDAVVELTAILEQRPAFVAARVALGVAYFSTGESAAATKALKAVLAEDPENSRAKLYLRMIESHAARTASEPGTDVKT